MVASHGTRHSLGFALACVAVLALGGLLRVEPWQPAPTPVPAVEVEATEEATDEAPEVKLPDGLAETLLGFYDAIDRGQYDRAYDLAWENKWEPGAGGEYVHAGLTPRAEFVQALNTELEPNGINLSIFVIRIADGREIEVPAGPTVDPLPYAIFGHLPDGARVTSLYQVDLEGWLGDACTPGPWTKQALVAGLDDGNWKVLLSGGRHPENKRRSEWFADKPPFEGVSLKDESRP